VVWFGLLITWSRLRIRCLRWRQCDGLAGTFSGHDSLAVKTRLTYGCASR
jgi:hypothetical protein